MDSPTSKYGSFLENFDKGNLFLQSAAQSFIDQVRIDEVPILKSTDLELSQSFSSVDRVLSNKDIDNYEKMNLIGDLLISLTPQIIRSTDPIAKNCGKNIINNFFNVAKKTQDQQILNTANQIAGRY